MGDGRCHEVAWGLRHLPAGQRHAGQLDHRAVREHDALRFAGGAARVLEPGEVLLAGGSRAQRLGLEPLHRIEEIVSAVGLAEDQEVADGAGSLCDLQTGLGEQWMDDQHLDLGVVADPYVVVQGAEGVQPGVVGPEGVGRGLGHPHFRDVDAQCADSGAVTDPPRLEDLLEPAHRLSRLGVGHPPVTVDKGLALRVSGQRLDYQPIVGCALCSLGGSSGVVVGGGHLVPFRER